MMLALGCNDNTFDCSVSLGLVWGFSFLTLNIGIYLGIVVWTAGLTRVQLRQVRHWSHMLTFRFEIYCTVVALAVACHHVWAAPGGQISGVCRDVASGRRLASCSSSGRAGWGRPGDIECACSLIH